MSDHVSQTTQVYNKIAEKYAQAVANYGPEPERKKFITLIKPQGKILDAGCGSGRDVEYFSKAGFSVVGIDTPEKLLSIASNKNPKTIFYKQDLRNLNFSDTSFDGIWACASLLHLKRSEIPSVVQRLHQLLKPQGILFVLVKQGTGKANVKEPLSQNLFRHFTYFQPAELKQFLTKSGFLIEDLYTYNENSRHTSLRDLVWIACFAKKI